MHHQHESLPQKSPEQMETEVGESLKLYRINMKKLDQATVAARAGISTKTLRNLEAGKGSSLKTFLLVLRALGRYSWVTSMAPDTFNPIVIKKILKQRQRVHMSKKSTS